MLPAGPNGDPDGRTAIDKATRYGTFAMETLINELAKQGSVRENLEVKLFGGGRVLEGREDERHKSVAQDSMSVGEIELF